MQQTKGPSERSEVLRLLTLLKPYQQLSARTFYTDLILTAIITWGSLWLVSARSFDWISGLVVVVAYLGVYRGYSFIHEVVHFQKKIKFLNPLYNLTFGIPGFFPSYIHEPHQFHHLPNTFATVKDPEYLYMEGRGLKYLFLPLIGGPLMPLIVTVRFGILPLILFCLPERYYLAIYRSASTLVVNPGYKREVRSPQDLAIAKRSDLYSSLAFLLWLTLAYFGVLSGWFFITFYCVLAAASTVNIYRARAAHRYDNRFDALSPFAQIRDSVTIESRIFYPFWAPVGLRFHSLHHLAPTVPYHNLARAHEFLKAQLPPEHVYNKTVIQTFAEGLRQYRQTITTKSATNFQV